ncbi:MAG: pentapeptide repeat-containing protein [Leptolyngbyaceae bacterium]|nr:pentapeptide repeat-containing protein [Leptolyngbyaceae bacterium]
MRTSIILPTGCLGLFLIVGWLYWITRPANTNWRYHTRDGFSDLRAVHWPGINLAGADLSGMIFRESFLEGANFQGANLRGADLSGATYVDDANFRGADLTGALLLATYARRANFAGAKLQDAQLQSANLIGANLSGADLAGADLTDASLVGANLDNWVNPPAYLDRANLTDANLPGNLENTRLCNTVMPNQTVSKQGCFWPSPELLDAFAAGRWDWVESSQSQLFHDANISAQTAEEMAIAIQAMPCEDLKVLDELWREASDNRFGFSVQRQIWENSVQQDYGKFAEQVGWKQGKTWIKWDDLSLNALDLNGSPRSAHNPPVGHLPWHRWQIQEPTEAEPTRFRRIGFGAWMGHLKQCGI